MSGNGEYIEREAAIKVVCENCNKIFPEEPCEPSDCTIMQMLRSIPAADVVPGSDFRDCRNELCLYCGKYKERHNGACDGCRWRICE